MRCYQLGVVRLLLGVSSSQLVAPFPELLSSHRQVQRRAGSTKDRVDSPRVIKTDFVERFEVVAFVLAVVTRAVPAVGGRCAELEESPLSFTFVWQDSPFRVTGTIRRMPKDNCECAL